MSEAYKSVQFDSLKKMYLEREKLLTVSRSGINAEEMDDKISKQVQEKTGNLSEFVNILSRKNETQERNIEALEKKDNETKKELKELVLIVKSLVNELEKLTEN